MSDDGQPPVIRRAKREDCGELLRLIKELNDHEGLPEDTLKIDERDLERDGFGALPRFHGFVCENPSTPGHLIGYALYNFGYSTCDVGLVVNLEDLYIGEGQRKRGLGKALVTAVIKAGLEEGCKKCNIGVLKHNVGTIQFYKKLGAQDLTDKEGLLSFAMELDAMQALGSL